MEKKYSLKLIVVLALVLITSALTCLALSLLFLWQFLSINQTKVENSDFEELLNVIETRFIGTADFDEVTNAAMRAAVDSLDDNWSFYMSPDEYKEFLAFSDNRYTGIGVDVVMDDETDGMRIVGVYRDSGADKAGMLVGDIVTAVDGSSIIGLSLDEIRDLLRRPIGDTAVLTVLRDDEKYYELTVEYNIVFTDPVSYEMLDGNIGYVLLQNFETGAAGSFIEAVNDLIEQGAIAFIYDVRSNHGGRVTEVTAILDFLLPEGEIFISVDFDGNETITKSDADFIDIPAVVLVNSVSYSGAEFFAAMLDEYNYALTVGEQTTGKNRMQTTIPLSNGGAVHISTAHYLTKNRISLFDAGGYTPDYIVPLSDEEVTLFIHGKLELYADPQFLKALSLLV